jgi:hypothetical protein
VPSGATGVTESQAIVANVNTVTTVQRVRCPMRLAVYVVAAMHVQTHNRIG